VPTAKSEELQALAQRVADALPPEAIEVVLTGSVSRGVADEVSDIEMLVVTEEQPVKEWCFEHCGLVGELGSWGAQDTPTVRVSGYRAGVPIERRGSRVSVVNTDELLLGEVRVPGDASSAAFLVAAGVLVPGSRLLIRDVGVNWTRTGFLRIVRRMRGIVLADLEEESEQLAAEEPVSDLDVAHGALEGTVVDGDEVPLAIDELPLVALLGCYAEGETVVRGAGELRVKESDRIAGVVDGLRALGAEIEGTDDGFAVRGGGGLRGGTLDARGDHRLAMMGAVAGLASREGVEVLGMDAAAVSYPSFVEDLEAVC